MAQYIVSARKYRPDSFEALIGQDNIARTLKNSILRGQLAHAYLFCGPRGVGKTSAARIFAKTINCAHPTADMEPCGECESCVSFREGRSYCIHELDAASNNGVEDIKALMEQVQIPPQVGRYSVYIIDEVHMLTQSAFNAFLKTLEEPPAHAIFILATTEKHKIIPTILSRCQTYDFNRISVPDIVRNLRDIAGKEGVSVDDESLHVIAHKADGAMRDALTIFDQTVAFCGTDIHYEDVIRNLNVLDYEYSFKLVDAFLAKDYATALLVFDEILAKGFNALHFVSALGSHLRDLLVSRTGGLDALLDLPDSLRARYRDQAARCSVKFIYEALGVISQCEGGYKAATNQRLHIEFALMRLAFLGGVPSVSDVAPVVSGAAPAAAAGAPKNLGKGRPASTAVPDAASTVPDAIPAAAAGAPDNLGKGRSGSTAGTAPVVAATGSKTTEISPVAAEKPSAGSKTTDISPVAAEKPSTGSKTAEISPAAPEKPVAAEKPAAPVRPAPKRRASGLSLASLMDDEEITVELAAEEAPTPEISLPDAETINAKWQELAAMYHSQPRLANALSGAKLDARESDGLFIVSFAVVNEAQKNWIAEKKLRELEERFRKLIDCPKIRLEPCVIPEEEHENKIYMPQEKARDLMSKNVEVGELVKDLALDIR
ncbi:MAG: DNA polymerase III subunit gamma/tau [Bacteroidales bacterium]|nr:DNA polymerase III subunit gamma/tau [Bacteroidales bacterium]